MSGREGALMDIRLIHIEHAHPSSPAQCNIFSILSQEAGESAGQTARVITCVSNVSQSWLSQLQTNDNNK